MAHEIRKPVPAVPKVLLVTHGDPQSHGIAELFLKDVASAYPRHQMFRFSLVDSSVNESSTDWIGFSSRTYRVQFSAIPIASSLCQLYFKLFTIGKVADELEKLIEEKEIDIVWLVLNSGNMIHLANHLIKSTSKMIVTMIWDTPEHFAKNQYFDFFTRRSMLQAFARVLQQALRVAVISEGMQDEFRVKYGIESIVIRHGIQSSFWHKPSSGLKSEDISTIGFAGSLPCKKEWNLFIQSVNNLNRQESAKIRIKFIGRFPHFGAKKDNSIDFLGVLPFSETIEELSKTDLAYVPLWFDRKHSFMAKTAFPSKISAYTAAGIPVLYHGPRDSSPTLFWKKYSIGLCCHSLKCKDIEDTIRKLLFDKSVRAQALKDQQKALREEFDRERMLDRFSSFLGIDRNALDLKHADFLS